MPYQEHGADAAAILLEPGKIHNTADIEQHCRLIKLRRHRGEQRALCIRQIEAAFFQRVFPILARGTANHHHGALGMLRRLMDELLRNRHFRIKARPMAPGAVLDRVRCTPGLINAGKLFIQRQPFTTAYPLQQINRIGLFYISA